MSLVTDVVIVLPSTGHYGEVTQRVRELFTYYGHQAPTPVEDNGDHAPGTTVYHLGVDYMNVDLCEALKSEPWPTGMVLLIEHENDQRPFIKIFGPVPEGGWDSEPEYAR